MDDRQLLTHAQSDDPSAARIEIDPDTRSSTPVNGDLYGKFCEHLRRNVYGGMWAQVLENPTFGSWPFPADGRAIDGGRPFEHDPDRIAARIEAYADERGYPDAARAVDALDDGAAFPWIALDPGEEVALSPDTGPTGDRAQRVEALGTSDRPAGLFQWTHLPLWRTRGFEFRLVARAREPTGLDLSIRAVEDGEPGVALAIETVDVGAEWTTVEGHLAIPDDLDLSEDDLYAVCATTQGAANVVLDRLLLYPDDHVDGADPEVIEYLRDAGLPLLRWPGGNFASGYRWRDGVGPRDERPTTPNPAWGGLEYNLFGTDEFLAFCEAVGCEPMICVNAGDGTPDEAADWVEYCNGSTDTPMGALRAEHGRPEPYGITHWEVGNELYGRWQVRWTTPGGYADRFERFRDAMTAVDPEIEVYACGNRTRHDDWNRRLLAAVGDGMRSITDHVLTGGTVGPDTDPDELYHAFLGFASQLGREYRDLRDGMSEAGIDDPRLAITELQLFADFEGEVDESEAEGDESEAGGGEGAALTAETMPTPHTISEALYDATIVHECVRMGEFVSLLTHSATVNHGGGLQKARERVWADPCHYGHAMGAALAGQLPVGVALECGTISTEGTFDEILPVEGVPAIDAMAAVDPDGSALVVMLVHRSSEAGPISCTLDVGGFDAAPSADVTTLAGETMYDGNTHEEPGRVVPESTTEPVRDGSLELALAPYSLTRIVLSGTE